MGFILKKVRIENLKERTDVYSKLIRGNLNFILETHSLNNGHTLQVFLYRDHPRVKEFIEKAQEKKYYADLQKSADNTKLEEQKRIYKELNELK